MDMYQRTFAALNTAGWPQDEAAAGMVFEALRREVTAELAQLPADERQQLLDKLEKAIRRLDVERHRL